jgi:hypothetical protein
MVFAFLRGKAMSKPKQFIQLIAYTGIALIFLALASRILNADSVNLSVSPINGINVKAEGVKP